MGITAAIVGGVGAAASTGYSIYAQNQAAKRAKAAQADALNSRPNAAADQLAANQTALDAQASQRKKAQGLGARDGTLLTGPSGVSTPPPATKTLLGL